MKPTILEVLEDAVRVNTVNPAAQPAVALARRLALEIDQATDPDVVARLSARLVPTLEAAGLTAKGRTGGSADGRTDVLDELKARRARER